MTQPATSSKCPECKRPLFEAGNRHKHTWQVAARYHQWFTTEGTRMVVVWACPCGAFYETSTNVVDNAHILSDCQHPWTAVGPVTAKKERDTC